MTTPINGPISMFDLHNELSRPVDSNGRPNPISLNDFNIRRIAYVPTGAISLNDLYNIQFEVQVDILVVGGGGGGGGTENTTGGGGGGAGDYLEMYPWLTKGTTSISIGAGGGGGSYQGNGGKGGTTTVSGANESIINYSNWSITSYSYASEGGGAGVAFYQGGSGASGGGGGFGPGEGGLATIPGVTGFNGGSGKGQTHVWAGGGGGGGWGSPGLTPDTYYGGGDGGVGYIWYTNAPGTYQFSLRFAGGGGGGAGGAAGTSTKYGYGGGGIPSDYGAGNGGSNNPLSYAQNGRANLGGGGGGGFGGAAETGRSGTGGANGGSGAVCLRFQAGHARVSHSAGIMNSGATGTAGGTTHFWVGASGTFTILGG